MHSGDSKEAMEASDMAAQFERQHTMMKLVLSRLDDISRRLTALDAKVTGSNQSVSVKEVVDLCNDDDEIDEFDELPWLPGKDTTETTLKNVLCMSPSMVKRTASPEQTNLHVSKRAKIQSCAEASESTEYVPTESDITCCEILKNYKFGCYYCHLNQQQVIDHFAHKCTKTDQALKNITREIKSVHYLKYPSTICITCGIPKTMCLKRKDNTCALLGILPAFMAMCFKESRWTALRERFSLPADLKGFCSIIITPGENNKYIGWEVMKEMLFNAESVS